MSILTGTTKPTLIAFRKRERPCEVEECESDGRPRHRQIQLTNPDSICKPLTTRDRLLQKEIMDLNPEVLPTTVRVTFPDPNIFHEFSVQVTPNEGLWRNGVFNFIVKVPTDYNMCPPKVSCVTPVWHPNIQHPGGQVCLSLLRVACVDELGWTPTRQLKDIVLGLDALFGDLVNFQDPLNSEAAHEYFEDPQKFFAKVGMMIKFPAQNIPLTEHPHDQ